LQEISYLGSTIRTLENEVEKLKAEIDRLKGKK